MGIARRLVGVLLVALGALCVAVFDAGQASAHTGFSSSTPADGAMVETPVELVSLVFTGEANPVGDGFVALTADGIVQAPVSVQTLDNQLFSLRFDPPLAGGEIGLRWSVQAADAHPIEGAFSFTVTAPAPVDTAPVDTAPIDTAPTDTAPVDTGVSQPTQSLDEFLTVDTARPGDTTATVGRLVGLLGVVLGLGGFAFVSTTLRGRREEVSGVLLAVRVLGIIVAGGAAIEYVGVSRIGAESLGSGWSTGAGFATVLRFVGGIGLAAGLIGRWSRRSRGDGHEEQIVRWSPDARSWPALGGSVLIITSFWFDGHTVSKGFQPLHAVVNSVHVTAGSVWAGGVVAMAVVIWSRSRAGTPTGVVELVLRFSRVATVALVAVLVAGAVMALLILDSFGELTGTPWGKILLLKSAGVGLAAIGGAYNHFRLLPALEADSDAPDVLDRLRGTVTAEAILLLFVVAVTAWLVAAAS